MTAVDGTNYTREFFLKIFKLFNSVGNFFTIWSFNALLQKFSTNNFCKAFYNFKDCLFTVHQIGQHYFELSFLLSNSLFNHWFFCNAIFVFPNIFMRNFRPKFSSVYFGMIFSTLGLFHCSLSSHFMI